MAKAHNEIQEEATEVKQKKIDITTEINAKITASYEKLSAKFREKSERASEHLKNAKNETKRTTYRRRFELYGDAATDLDGRVRLLKGGSDNGAD